MITLDQAKKLYHGQVLYHVNNRNSDGSPQRWRVNGQPKTWKTRPNEVQVPLKHGMYDFGYLTERELGLVCLNEQDAKS